MNELSKTRLFNLLAKPSQEVTNDEMQNAYGDFVKHIEAIDPENDFTKIYRNLNITRIELSTLESFHRYEQGEKCA
jgi:hypothetical protein